MARRRASIREAGTAMMFNVLFAFFDSVRSSSFLRFKKVLDGVMHG